MANGKGKRGVSTGGPGSREFRLFEKRRDSLGFPWQRIDRGLCVAMLHAATANGAAVMFGSTQGGRGIVVTVFYDKDRAKAYAGTEEEFADLATEIIEELQSPSEDMFAMYGIDSAGEAADD